MTTKKNKFILSFSIYMRLNAIDYNDLLGRI